MQRLRQGLRKTSGGITRVFTGVRIDESLYEELEAALLMADTGVPATEHLLTDLRRRVKERLGPVLREHGLFFVGIDVIGVKLTEINVTSPTGHQEVNALDDFHGEKPSVTVGV